MKKDGGPAFPTLERGSVNADAPYDEKVWKAAAEVGRGMSLRDYFAGQIINGMMAGTASNGWHEMSQSAYKYADAMLAERDK